MTVNAKIYWLLTNLLPTTDYKESILMDNQEKLFQDLDGYELFKSKLTEIEPDQREAYVMGFLTLICGFVI